MKFKNSELLDIKEAFDKVPKTFSLPISVAWKRRLNYKQIIKICQVIGQALDELSFQYAGDEFSYTDERDGIRKIRNEFFKEFTDKRKEIINQETDIDIKTINIKELGKDLKITDEEMDTIAFMIDSNSDNDDDNDQEDDKD